MRPRILQVLTWATVAAAVLSALWLAWAEAGGARHDGLPVGMAPSVRVADGGPRGAGRHSLPQALPRPAHASSSR